MKRHGSKKLDDAGLSLRFAAMRATERERYARTVGWLRCCASRCIHMQAHDAYIVKCPGGHHELAVLDDRMGTLKTQCRYCLFPTWRLHHFLENILETT